jgi:hypothetical protein
MKEQSPFEKFDSVMSGLLTVSRSELQRKLVQEERAKAKKKKRPKTASSRVSASRKGRGT